MLFVDIKRTWVWTHQCICVHECVIVISNFFLKLSLTFFKEIILNSKTIIFYFIKILSQYNFWTKKKPIGALRYKMIPFNNMGENEYQSNNMGITKVPYHLSQYQIDLIYCLYMTSCLMVYTNVFLAQLLTQKKKLKE